MKSVDDLVALTSLSQSNDKASLSILQNRKFQQRYFWRRYGIRVVRVWQKQVTMNPAHIRDQLQDTQGVYLLMHNLWVEPGTSR